MSKEVLGKIQKPSIEDYKKSGRRKLYLVPFFLPGADKELFRVYQNKLLKYWKQVESRINLLEEKLGKIKKVYHEMVDKDGEEGAKIIQQISEASWKIVKELLDKGAKLQGIEDPQLVQEHLDWVRCLSSNLQTNRVSAIISSFFSESLRKRDEYISKKIDQDLKKEEIAVLFIRENNFLNLPSDIEVFRIYPPALEELRSFLQKLQGTTPF